VVFVPLQPSLAPLLLAMHEAAFDEVHVNVVGCPTVRLVGFAEKDTEGTVSVTTTSPTAPCAPLVQ
jgi:hypothetical protein